MCEAKSKACLFLSKDHNVYLYIGLVVWKFWQSIAVWTDFFGLFQQNLSILSVHFSIHTDCCAVNVLSYWLVLISSFALIGCSFIAYIYVFVKYPHGLTGQIWNYKCSFNCWQHAFAMYTFAMCACGSSFWFYPVNLVSGFVLILVTFHDISKETSELQQVLQVSYEIF